MGHVKFEQRNEGRGIHEWDYMPLSEARIVAEQIKHRSKLDAAYQIKSGGGSLLDSSGTYQMAEPILCTYMDLDRLIERADLSSGQLEIVKQLMDGNTLSDIAELSGRSLTTVDVQFRRAVDKIVTRNNADWLDWSSGNCSTSSVVEDDCNLHTPYGETIS